MFWSSKSVFLNIWDEIPYLVDEESGHGNNTCDSDRQKAESNLTDVEVVDWWVNKWEYLEEGVVYTVGERSLTVVKLAIPKSKKLPEHSNLYNL
jgi:hypothetical protein